MGRTKVGVGIFVGIVAARLARAADRPLLTDRASWRRRSPPASAKAWLGTDYIGHDVLTRVLYGGRTVIVLALAATVIGLVLGVGPGARSPATRGAGSTRPSCASSTSSSPSRRSC